MSPVAICGTDTPLDTPNPDVNYTALGLASRTWVLLTEAPDGGWGLAGHANTNEELVAAARAQLASLAAGKQAGD